MKFFILAALAAVAVADNIPAPRYAPAPTYAPRPTYNRPSYAAPQYPDVAPAYNYEYAVNDGYSGVQLSQNEARDGYATNGQWSVVLPDGRTQTVTYNVADDQSGAIMDVQYTGEAKYPEAKPAAYAPRPTYAPRPAYQA